MMRTILIFITALLLHTTIAFADNQPAAPHTNFGQVAQEIAAAGDALLEDYTSQNTLAAMNGFSSLYFDYYEGKGMELAVMAISPTMNIQTENLFTRLIGLAGSNASRADMQLTLNQLKAKLIDDVTLLESNKATTFGEVLLQAFLILLREGFEAMLVITALLTYLRRAGHSDKVHVIYYGIGSALAASAITAFLFNSLFHGAGANREAMEGITMLVAAGVLFYVSYWLFSKREAHRWQNYIKNKMNKALTTGSLFTLGLAAFLAVYREGAETILFYQALAGNGAQQPMALAIGIISATATLLLLYWAMQKASFRIPYTLFFTVTAAFLYYMAFYFIGGGVLELQEAGWIGISPILWIPPLSWLGIYPTWQSVGAQAIFLIPSMIALLWYACRTRVHAAQQA